MAGGAACAAVKIVDGLLVLGGDVGPAGRANEVFWHYLRVAAYGAELLCGACRLAAHTVAASLVNVFCSVDITERAKSALWLLIPILVIAPFLSFREALMVLVFGEMVTFHWGKSRIKACSVDV
jgi:hypothetical protein